MFSQLIGQFDHLNHHDDTISKIANRVLSRDGHFEDSDLLKGKAQVLSTRQQSEVGIDSGSCLSYKQLDRLNLADDDVTFRIGDTIYLKGIRHFGVIKELFVIKNLIQPNKSSRYADVQLYSESIYDRETNIPLTISALTDTITLQKLCNLSEPLITAIDENMVWFVSHEEVNNFFWLDEHVRL